MCAWESTFSIHLRRSTAGCFFSHPTHRAELCITACARVGLPAASSITVPLTINVSQGSGSQYTWLLAATDPTSSHSSVPYCTHCIRLDACVIHYSIYPHLKEHNLQNMTRLVRVRHSFHRSLQGCKFLICLQRRSDHSVCASIVSPDHQHIFCNASTAVSLP